MAHCPALERKVLLYSIPVYHDCESTNCCIVFVCWPELSGPNMQEAMTRESTRIYAVDRSYCFLAKSLLLLILLLLRQKQDEVKLWLLIRTNS